VANLVSAAVIALLSQLLFQVQNVFLALLLLLGVAWLVEGFALMLLRKRTASQSYLAALVANFSAFIFAYAYVFTFLIIEGSIRIAKHLEREIRETSRETRTRNIERLNTTNAKGTGVAALSRSFFPTFARFASRFSRAKLSRHSRSYFFFPRCTCWGF
jgi:hypothetical protein